MQLEKINKELDQENKKNFIDSHIYSELGQYIFNRQYSWMDVFDDFTLACDEKLYNYEDKLRAIELFTLHNDEFKYPYNYGNYTKIQTNEEVIEMIKMNKGENSDSDDDSDEENIDDIDLNGDWFEVYYDLGVEYASELPFKNKNGDHIYMVMWPL